VRTLLALDLPKVFLGIGEGGVFDRPVRVETVLGSCVAVTLHCPVLRVGAAFHAFMPYRDQGAGGGPLPEEYRFVDAAVETVWRQLARLGTLAGRVQAKVFGGASGLVPAEMGVGLRNVRAAFEALALCGIRVAASSVGGDVGRRLVFFPASGDVLVRRLPRLDEGGAARAGGAA
jgi:chemotaxis protein CheD